MSVNDSPPGHRDPAEPPPPSRREPLPWQRPKPEEDDPRVAERLRKILESPSYRLAVDDRPFLERDELRAARLQIEYLKPEILLTEHGIESTIVVYGGTRIVETAEARRRAEELRALAAQNPGDAACRRKLGAAERVLASSRYYDVAREFGRLVAEACRDGARSDLVIATGGGPGIMEAANRGAFEAGAKNAGFNITLPHEQFPNPYITPELCFQFRYFALRKLHFLKRAKALVAFAGGFGTFDELFETLMLIQTRKIEPLPVVLVGEEFWRRAFNADFLADEGVIDPEDVELFTYAETAREIWDHIVAWYRKAGNELPG